MQAARATGWLAYHPYDSRKSEPGFPDVFAVHPHSGKAFFAELKTSKGRLTPAQKMWIAALESSQIPVYVFRPADWPEIEAVLTGGAK